MTVPVTARGMETRARLLSAAEKVFGDDSYYRVSISDITREAGVGQGTFYVYFPSKEDIFRELVQQRAHELRAVTHLATSQADGDRIDAERSGFAAFFAFIDQHRQLYRVVRQAESVDEALYREYYQAFAEGYRVALGAAMDRGEIARMDPEVLAYVLMGIGDFVGMRCVIWTGAPIRNETFEDVVRFIQAGLTAQPRRPDTGGEGGE
ncbi:MAG: TetR/AcrR family transcriptional regulator [Chloroflexota bacterium]